MSGFLTRLAERSLGVARVASPRPRARYEPLESAAPMHEAELSSAPQRGEGTGAQTQRSAAREPIAPAMSAGVAEPRALLPAERAAATAPQPAAAPSAAPAMSSTPAPLQPLLRAADSPSARQASAASAPSERAVSAPSPRDATTSSAAAPAPPREPRPEARGAQDERPQRSRSQDNAHEPRTRESRRARVVTAQDAALAAPQAARPPRVDVSTRVAPAAAPSTLAPPSHSEARTLPESPARAQAGAPPSALVTQASARGASPAELAPRDNAHAEPARIEISIGHIEVRAAPPPAARQQAAAQGLQHIPSLASYLATRNRRSGMP
jgi:hypothetical protein